jgi:cytochrome c oxidase subunit 3
MAQTEIQPPRKGNDGNNGDDHGGWRNGGDGTGGFEHRISTAKLLIYLLVCSLSVGFAALALIYILRTSDKLSYPFTTPKSLWVSTAFIVMSSFTCIWAIRAIQRGNQRVFSRMTAATLALGCCFLASQSYAWWHVREQIVSASPAPIRNLFYVVTGIHAAHLFVGLVWLGVLVWQSRSGVYTSKRKLGPELCAVYWHFLDVGWLILFTVLMLR